MTGAARWVVVAWIAVGCGGGEAAPADAGGQSDASAGPDALPACDPAAEYTGPLPAGAEPCTDATRWPLALRSSSLPVAVRYSRCDQTEMAAQVLALVEQAWQLETGALGFAAPLADGGMCGDDDAFDVFLWPDRVESYVEAIAANPDTAHDDWLTYMVLDPWGPYGGDLLGSTIAHELNHACQATDDWWEHIAAFEMTATFVEEIAHPDADQWQFVLDDFQAHPDWSVDRDDGYETWYMYGASLLLHLVRERYFAGDPGFAGAMWRASRNPPGDNEPDFVDALGELLTARAGVGFGDAVGELAVWRWYTGDRADGAHFADAALYPQPAVASAVTSSTASVVVEPMVYGTVYIDVTGTGERSIQLETDGDPAIRWLVQALPGAAGASADLLDPDGDRLVLDGFGARTVAITALPVGERDPDDQADERLAATLHLEP